MIYPTDFNNYNLSKSDVFTKGKKGRNSVSILHIPPHIGFNGKIRKEEVYTTISIESDESTWTRYCDNSTVHGLRYLTHPKVQFAER